MRFLIIFVLLISNTFAEGVPEIKNIIVNKELKTHDNITFLDKNNKTIKLVDYEGSLVLLNFWATWCGPCREEMISLDDLKKNKSLDKIEIFPINIGKDSLIKSEKFFKELGIKNLDIYYDNPITLAKKFNLRGIPTTILFNRNSEEFARIIGSIDFGDKKFIEWLENYN